MRGVSQFIYQGPVHRSPLVLTRKPLTFHLNSR